MSLAPNLPPDRQRKMLHQMLTIRRFEERASADYLAGKIDGVVHCYVGEEAVAVELYGRRTGYCKGKGGSMHIADFSIGMLGANGIVAGGLSAA